MLQGNNNNNNNNSNSNSNNRNISRLNSGQNNSDSNCNNSSGNINNSKNHHPPQQHQQQKYLGKKVKKINSDNNNIIIIDCDNNNSNSNEKSELKHQEEIEEIEKEEEKIYYHHDDNDYNNDDDDDDEQDQIGRKSNASKSIIPLTTTTTATATITLSPSKNSRSISKNRNKTLTISPNKTIIQSIINSNSNNTSNKNIQQPSRPNILPIIINNVDDDADDHDDADDLIDLVDVDHSSPIGSKSSRRRTTTSCLTSPKKVLNIRSANNVIIGHHHQQQQQSDQQQQLNHQNLSSSSSLTSKRSIGVVVSNFSNSHPSSSGEQSSAANVIGSSSSTIHQVVKTNDTGRLSPIMMMNVTTAANMNPNQPNVPGTATAAGSSSNSSTMNSNNNNNNSSQQSATVQSSSSASSLLLITANNNNNNSNNNAGTGNSSNVGGANSSNNSGSNSATATQNQDRFAFYDFNDQEFMSNDNKYKQYALAIDKALKSFEYTSEWADLVNALGKLNRVLANNSRFCKIPRRFVVGQRLAQCMHPLLPSGVHLKALETYNLIFSCLGPEKLLADLTIYSNGLFPLLGYAAINVRPSVLEVYEKHLLPLGERLKLALDGFLISLLPCYEEGSESFQRTDTLLLNVANGVGVAYFYGSLWRCILQNSSIRLPAITFVLMHFNKKRPLAEQAHVLGLCMRTLVRAICASLLDTHILVQRAILDLLMTIFPIHINLMNEMEQAMSSPQNTSHSTIISPSIATNQMSCSSPTKHPLSINNQVMSRKYFKRSELVAIITAALTVLLRRDLSLNRRLSAWFFGSDSSSGSGSSSTNSGAVSSQNLSQATSVASSSGFISKSSSQSIFSGANQSTSGNTTNLKENSSEAKARRKKLMYFDTYSRDLVIEAFKRCITNPLTAITSILPQTALTNSFISFTLPYVPSAYANQAASASSSPSSSASSLLHLSSFTPYRTNSTLHGNSSRGSFLSNHSTNDAYTTQTSTFWPYRLLICILDQRDISTPILEALCLDILRGLYHEFELLTTLVPPPTVVEGSNDTMENPIKQSSDDNLNSPQVISSNLHDSSTTISSASLISSALGQNLKSSSISGRKKVKRIKSTRKSSINKKKGKEKRRNLSTGSVKNQKNRTQTTIKKESSETSTLEMVAAEMSPNEEEEQLKSIEPQTFSEMSDDDRIDGNLSDEITTPSIIVPNTATQIDQSAKALKKSPFYKRKKTKSGDVDQRIDNEILNASKRNTNLFQNIRQNVRNRFNKIPFPLGNNNNNSNNNSNAKTSSQNQNSNEQSGQPNKMKTAVKTFVTKQRWRLMKNDQKSSNSDGKLRKKKKDGNGNNLLNELGSIDSTYTSSSTAIHNTSNEEIDGGPCSIVSQSNIQMIAADEDDDDQSVFELPHQHYYWNPFYQQLNKNQRQELVKELDRVMQLLFDIVGVEFVWTKLALTFSAAAAESIELEKILYIMVKTTIRSTTTTPKTAKGIKSTANLSAKSFEDTNDDDDNDAEDEDEDENDSISNSFHSSRSISEAEKTANSSSSSSSSASSTDINVLRQESNDSVECVEEESDNYVQEHLTSEYEPESADDDTDTISRSLSSAWIKNLPLSFFKHLLPSTNEQQRFESNLNLNSTDSSLFSSQSSIPYHSPRVISPDIERKTVNDDHNRKRQHNRNDKEHYDGHDYGHGHHGEGEEEDDDGIEGGEDSPKSVKQLKNKLLLALTDICRQCGQTLTFNSPVQPVGTESITILEACTLVRFLLGDSKPYHKPRFINLDGNDFGANNNGIIGNSNGINDDDDFLYSSTDGTISNSSLLTNSVSASMNRCSSLEPLSVDTDNYHYLIHFLDHILKLMCQSAKSFTSIDLHASIELCLALCSKIKPAIMQSFFLRYRNKITELKNKESDSQRSGSGFSQQHSRKPSLTNSWFNNGTIKIRSSSTSSSSSSKPNISKQLERVKEETEEIDENDQINSNDKNNIEAEDQQKALDEADLNDDFQLELVVDGVLEFFSTFVETIMVKRNIKTIQDGVKNGRNELIDFYRKIILNDSKNDHQIVNNRIVRFFNNQADTNDSKSNSIHIRYQYLPIYQLLCELMIEVGTIPLLSSPACLLKNRDCIDNLQMDQPSFENIRWLPYLMVLSANGLSSCSEWHHLHHLNNRHHRISFPLACCQIRQIAYTSLCTILDLMTITRAYVLSPSSSSLSSRLIGSCIGDDDQFPIPSFEEMKSLDLFPNTIIARRLNFFPLVHPCMLQHIYHQSNWFKWIASGLWSNLSNRDSALHHATSALLQQLHSISLDESVCEAVICDEMIGGGYYGLRGMYHNQSNQDRLIIPSSSIHNNMSNENNFDIVRRSRSKFSLMFAIIRDIRFISERLALLVNALSLTAKKSSDTDSIDMQYNDYYDQKQDKMISQLEWDVATSTTSSTSDTTLANDVKHTLNVALLTNFNDLHRLLRITCPISPVALCSKLKRHFDRPLFIMLDALAQRRTLSHQYSFSADWLLRCIEIPDTFGMKNLMFASPSGFGITSEFTSDYNQENNRTDIGRLLEPLLFLLLHPNTARLSVKNVNILRYTRGKEIDSQNLTEQQQAQRQNSNTPKRIINDQDFNYVDDDYDSPTTSNKQQIDESKIYAISSPNGNVIYHIRRRPPSRSNPTSIDHSPTHEEDINRTNNNIQNDQIAIKITSNPIEQHIISRPSSVASSQEADNAVRQILDDLMEQVTVEIVHQPDIEIDISNFFEKSIKDIPPAIQQQQKQESTPMIPKAFPGMASYLRVDSPTKSSSMMNENDENFGVGFDSKTKLRFSDIHQHLLLYERRYDSSRTTYALDTILALIETWPSQVLYSMSTDTVFNNSLNHPNGTTFDGNRSAQIKTLYQKHLNSINGNGFCCNSINNNNNNSNNSNIRSTNAKMAVNSSSGSSKTKHVPDIIIDDNDDIKNNMENFDSINNNDKMTQLELIVQICLQYLRSYYPSCPADITTTRTANKLSNDVFLHVDNFFNIRSNNCIDLEAINGNQRVRLLACQVLRIIFYHLNEMIEVSNQKESKHSHKRQPSDSLLCLNQSKSFAEYLREMMMKCEIQKNILQCLVTSVWHYEQKNFDLKNQTQQNNKHQAKKQTQNQQRKYPLLSESYVYPDNPLKKTTNPADIAFIKEILDYNDYPERILNLDTTDDNNTTKASSSNYDNDYDDDGGFHDQLEKSLLNLIEQVMKLESRIQILLTDYGTKNSSTDYSNIHHLQRSSITKDLFEMNFDTKLPIAGQPLLNGAFHYALQQNYRRHVHSEWLSFFESILHFAGRFMPRLVLTVITQLCRNLDSSSKEIVLFSTSFDFSSTINHHKQQEQEQQQIPPFTYRHFLNTLQGIAMIYSYCLLDRPQYEVLAPVLKEILYDFDYQLSSTFGLTNNGNNSYSIRSVTSSSRHHNNQNNQNNQNHHHHNNRHNNRSKNHHYDQWSLNSNNSVPLNNNVSPGAIQAISSFLHNMILSPISSSGTVTGNGTGGGSTGTNGGSGGSGQNNNGSNSIDSNVDSLLISSTYSPLSSSLDNLANNLSITRQCILDFKYLNRVVKALFNVWCIMVVRDDNNYDYYQNSDAEYGTSMNQYSTCCHPYLKQSRHPIDGLRNFNFNATTNNSNNPYVADDWYRKKRYIQSSCSSGWSSSVYTGWYITGSSAMIRHSILTILRIVTVSNGISLMQSIARVWHDLRDRQNQPQNSNHHQESLLADAIDVVITPVTSNQQKLVQLISSLAPILNLEYLIQIVRAILKPSSSSSSSSSSSANNSSSSSNFSSLPEVPLESTGHSFTSNPFDNIFLIEVSLLEFFLAYIRTCPGKLLLNSCHSMLQLIKDGFALNLTASVPYPTFWPHRNRSSTYHYNQEAPSHSVQIDFQPLINIHLLAILHEFVITAPFSDDDRKAMKELQDLAQKLIDANINVAGGRLLQSRFWSFRRNMEVMPVKSDIVMAYGGGSGSGNSGRPSPTNQRSASSNNNNAQHNNVQVIDNDSHNNDQYLSVKRGLFRSSASVQFVRTPPASSKIDHSSHHQHHQHHSDTEQNQSESLLFGLFNFNLSYPTSSGGNSSGQTDLATTSQNLFYSFFCIKALYAMSEFAAPVLDVVYTSEEKEKMIPLITTLMSYVIPYLKSHSRHNLPCFDACSRLLASLSGYQYTRKAWRKETLELLLEPSFFQMLPECLPAWRTIIDHLMTHDKNTFREFLQRMSVAQSPSVSFKIFVPSSTKDQESEPRAQLVKRLAFILFCSEKDQYQKYMAEIQEKLIEIHRTSQQQSSSQSLTLLNSQSFLQSQVLLAFRVIILRMSPHYLASLWPFIYTEMFQVFLTIEQALIKVIREERKNDSSYPDHLETPLDFSMLRSSTGGWYHNTYPHRTAKIEPKISAPQLQLFLNACKLLDLALLLPSDTLPQFQLHKWAFISCDNSSSQPIHQTPHHHQHHHHQQPQGYDYLFSGSNSTGNINNANEINRQKDGNFSSLGGTTSGIADSNNDQLLLQQQQPSSFNLDLISSAMEILKTYSETNSLNSAFDSSSTGAPQSLPANLNTSPGTTTSTGNNPTNTSISKDLNCDATTFIPHVVFINHLLNYLTDCPTTTTQFSNCPNNLCPLLTISSIESIHDLHPFFAALLNRSNQATALNSAANYYQQQQKHSSDYYRTSLDYRMNSLGGSSTTSTAYTSNKNDNRRKSMGATTVIGSGSDSPNRRSSKFSSKSVKDSMINGRGMKKNAAHHHKNENSNNNIKMNDYHHHQSILTNGSSSGGCSLDELFINIDRIIANDFLEPLPSSTE